MPELDTLSLFTDANLVSSWRFQSNSNDEKVANNGTDTNTPTYVTGKFGKAINLVAASSQYVQLGTNASLNITGNFSVAAWINTTTIAAGPFFIYAKDDVAKRGFCFGIASGEVYTEKGGVGLLTSTGAGITVGQWFHVAATFDGSTWLLYANGVQVGTVAGTAIPTQATCNACIGRRQYSGAESYFDGKIDDVSIWNRKLTAAEILTMYKNTTNLLKFNRRHRYAGAITGL